MPRDACIDSGGALPSPPHVFSPPHAVDAHLRRLGSSPNLLELEYEEWIRRSHSLIVPPTLHQSWQACGPLLPDHARWRARCARVLPANWTLFLWSDDANRRLVQTFFPSFLSTYDGCAGQNEDANVRCGLPLGSHAFASGTTLISSALMPPATFTSTSSAACTLTWTCIASARSRRGPSSPRLHCGSDASRASSIGAAAHQRRGRLWPPREEGPSVRPLLQARRI